MHTINCTQHPYGDIGLPEMEEIIQRARAFETLVVFPHPYSATFTGIQNTYFPEGRLERLALVLEDEKFTADEVDHGRREDEGKVNDRTRKVQVVN